MSDPRLLLIDSTPIDGPAATSALKRVYLGDWDRCSLLHLLTVGEEGALAAGLRDNDARPVKSLSASMKLVIDGFRPQAILYRPVAEHPALHCRAMELLERSAAPIILWFMDDWPMRLKEAEPERFVEVDKDLRWLLKRSSLNWAISSPMAQAYAERYGAAFEVMRNAVAPDDWLLERRSEAAAVLIRYAGSLAPDTARDAVFTAAQAVSELFSEGLSVKLEIRTQQTWLDAYGADYSDLPSVSIERSAMTDKDYRRWLGAADILLMAYNFDVDTRRYLQYSFANKTPETLASGAAVLAYGPRGLATIDYLADASDIAEVVAEPDPSLLKEAVKRLAGNAALRRRLGETARAHAFSDFNAQKARRRFRKGLEAVMANAPSMSGGAAIHSADAVFDTISVKKSAYRKLAEMFVHRFPQTADLLRRLLSSLRRGA